MGRYKKTPLEKLVTKLNKLALDPAIKYQTQKVKVKNKVILEHNTRFIKYSKRRYYSTKIQAIVDEYFSVKIPLTHENLHLLSSNPINPPSGARRIIDLFRSAKSVPAFDEIILGASQNKILGSKISITKELYQTILKIDKEEGKDRKARFTDRVAPFLKSTFKLSFNSQSKSRDYSLLLKEIIESGELTKSDLVALSNKLGSGDTNQVIIEKQVNKQVKWLIETIELLLEDTELNTAKAKNFGNQKFGYSKASITGPEHLIEKILGDYGQFTLFGVPALLNTDKYVITSNSQSRSQFDLILITHLGDIEVVELKRTDETILNYDPSRGKFYPSKSLSIAIAQAERYITAVTKDNDEEYKIEGKKIREYINEQIGETSLIETIRPTALILIGSWQTLLKDYNKLSAEKKHQISENAYTEDGLRAYREIKNSYRNIKILTYSELLEHARTRLEINKEKQK